MNTVTFPTAVSQFFSYVQEGNSPLLRQKFGEVFPDINVFANEENLRIFIEAAKTHIVQKKTAKAFSQALPPQIIESLAALQNEEMPELIRAYVHLRVCDMQNLDTADTMERMKEAEIVDELVRYKFASHAAKRGLADFTDQVDLCAVTNGRLNRRLAELALYFDAEKTCEDLNEFHFFKTEEREEFFLRGIIRSEALTEKLCDDSFFMASLETFPPEVLGFLYEHFQFGKEIIVEILKTSKLTLNEKELFVFLIQKSDYPAMEHEEPKLPILLNKMEDNEKNCLLAMLLFLKSIPSPQTEMTHPELLAFLKELKSLHDPYVRFAAVGIVNMAMKRHWPLLPTLSHPQSHSVPSSSYPKIFSLVLFSCERLCPQAKPGVFLEKKWADPEFRKQFVNFLAELLFSCRIEESEKSILLGKFFEKNDWQNAECLIDLSFCISRRLTKQLFHNQSPHQILLNQFQEQLDNLGRPYQCSFSAPLVTDPAFREDLSYYAQALEKLPADEKGLMIPFFFRFLNLTATGQMVSERFNTPELTYLFNTYPLNRQAWVQPAESSVKEILKRNAQLGAHLEERLDLKEEIITAFEQGHIQPSDYAEFHHYALGKAAPPLIEGSLFGQLKNSNKKEDQKRAISHILTKLWDAQEIKLQVNYLNQLLKFFPKESEFFRDMQNWKKGLEKQIHEQNKSYDDYKIVKSSDPKLLFRIGSLAGETCQRVKGDPARNKCLLSYPCDGKNEVLVAFNPKGEIEARAIFRFFYAMDPKDHHYKLFPVLYLEPVYPSGTPSILRVSLALFAIECAQAVNAPLVRHLKPREDRAKHKEKIPALGTINGPAPFEYFDGTPAKIKPNNTGQGQWQDFIDGANVKILFHPKWPDEKHL